MKVLKSSVRGVVGVYKHSGPTSRRILNDIQRLTGERKVGHAGTLDPLAEGVLVVGIGREATKQLGKVVKKEKEYVAEVKLGETSTTDDEEGEKKESTNFQVPNSKEMEDVLKKFVGEIWQVPPRYSAVKVKGKEAYKLARKGEKVELEARKRVVKEIEILSYKWPVLKLRVVTGGGVYIRSLARDIGEELGVGGYLVSLLRTRVGDFMLENSYRVFNDSNH